MSEAETRRFSEALKHWAETVDAIRAQEHAEAIAKVEEREKVKLRRAFQQSALGEHYAGKLRS